jgi:LPS export ABC transporter protein LptC
MTRNWSYIIIVFVLLTGIISCTSDEEKQMVLNDRVNLPLETGKNIYITYTDSGLTKAKVFAPLLERYSNDERQETVMQKGITAYFYNTGSANQVERYDRDKKMIARNDVVLVSRKGDTLNTEELIWDEVKQKIYSDKFVRITTKNEIIMGDGFESNTEFTQYKIFSIRGVISLKN